MSNYKNIAGLAACCQALANPSRLGLLARLAACCPPGTTWQPPRGELACVGELARDLGLAPSTISHHLKELKGAGLIATRRAGQQVFCELNPRALQELAGHLQALAGRPLPLHPAKETAMTDAPGPDPALIQATVRTRYGEVAQGTDSRPPAGCCAGGCGCGTTSTSSVQLGYSSEELATAPQGADLGLGCGNPQAIAALRPGETVLDLGSGGGLDCFLAARQVGPGGRVIGVDMTPEMVARARQNARTVALANVDFRLGEIEHLPVADTSVDVILSNCVINLAADKKAVYREAFRVLKPGGRLAISDVVARAELPVEIKNDLALWSSCAAGALTVAELAAVLAEAGFAAVRITPNPQSAAFIKDWAPGRGLEDLLASAAITAVKPLPDSQAYFAGVAGGWDDLRAGFFPDRLAGDLLDFAGAAGGQLAADLGAGSGFLSQALLDRGLAVVAVDASPAMLAVLDAKLGGRPGFARRLGEAEHLPLGDGEVDLVVANMFLHHVADPPAALREAFRVLKPGRRLALADLARHDHGFLLAEHHDRWPGFQPEELRGWLADAGFAGISIRAYGRDCCADSACGGERAQVAILLTTADKPSPA